jgi:hypothetical protein
MSTCCVNRTPNEINPATKYKSSVIFYGAAATTGLSLYTTLVYYFIEEILEGQKYILYEKEPYFGDNGTISMISKVIETLSEAIGEAAKKTLLVAIPNITNGIIIGGSLGYYTWHQIYRKTPKHIENS